jgi:hypothetical protein
VRALIYQYELTNADERDATGHWWKRHDRMLYAPILGTQIERPKVPDADAPDSGTEEPDASTEPASTAG